MVEDFFNLYGFVEKTEFDGLEPKVMEMLGDDYCPGLSKETVSVFDPTAKGADSLKIISAQKIAVADVPTGTTKPAATENTEEQQEVEQQVVETLLSGEKNVVIEDGTINNITIPSGVTVLANITGEFQDGAQIKSESPKAFTVSNTSEEPIDIVVEGNSTIYLNGKYDDVYVVGKGISVANSNYPEIHGTVTIDESYEGPVSISANFVGDDAEVVYLGNNTLTVNNSNEESDIKIYAPHATVTLNGKYEETDATVSQDTLILRQTFHTNKLNVHKGKVVYYGIDFADFVDELVSDTQCDPYTFNITETNVSKLTGNPGIYTLTTDTRGTVGYGVLASGKYALNLNGKTYTGTNKNYSFFLRNAVNLNVYGPGKATNSLGYNVWLSGENTVMNIYGGDWEGVTHTLYAEKGTINVYGGTFKLLGEYDVDEHGLAKFLLNCYDANYTAGTAKINVYGGKFYNFNPAESMSEPGGPVSFVAEGYKVVESVEDGVRVFEVVKDE